MKSSAEAMAQLTAMYLRNGYARQPNLDRRAESPLQYKKGYEVRLVAHTAAELRTIRRLLRQAGFKCGRAFDKGRYWGQPLYGRRQVGRFLEMVLEAQPAEAEDVTNATRSRSKSA